MITDRDRLSKAYWSIFMIAQIMETPANIGEVDILNFIFLFDIII